MYFGLAAGDKVTALRLYLPDGRLVKLHNIKVDTLLTVKQGGWNGPINSMLGPVVDSCHKRQLTHALLLSKYID